MWRGKQSTQTRKRFECPYCIRNGLAELEGRHCYRYGDETCLIIIPDVDDDGKVLSTSSCKELSRDAFTSEFVSFCQSRVENPFRVSLNFFGGKPGTSNVCFISLFDTEFNDLLLIADRCETYHTLYAPGSISQQPNWIMEIFDVFRATKAEYEAERMEELRGKK